MFLLLSLLFLAASPGVFAQEATFTGPTQRALDANSPRDIVGGDFNNDGFEDLAVALSGGDRIDDPGSVNILLGDGSGGYKDSFQIPAGYALSGIATADFDNDGNLDLALTESVRDGDKLYDDPFCGVKSGVSILMGQGDGDFVFRECLYAGSLAHTVLAADFTNDGITDLLVSSNAFGKVSLLAGDGKTFSLASEVRGLSLASDMDIADFNKDGNLDAVVATYGDYVNVLLGDGKGNLTLERLWAGYLVGSVAAGDMNSDGNPDIVATSMYQNWAMVYEGNGDGTMQPADYQNLGIWGSDVSMVDLNLDGNQDLIMKGWDGGKAYVMMGNGDLTLDQLRTYVVGSMPLGDRTMAVDAFDMNGDALLDLVATVARFNNDDAVSVLMQEGSAPVNPTPQPAPVVTHDLSVGAVSSPTAVVLGDLLTVTAEVVNLGNVDEAATVSLKDLTGAVLAQTDVWVASGTQQTVSLTWDTAGAMAGVNDLTLEVATVAGETNTQDNAVGLTVELTQSTQPAPAPTPTVSPTPEPAPAPSESDVVTVRKAEYQLEGSQLKVIANSSMPGVASLEVRTVDGQLIGTMRYRTDKQDYFLKAKKIQDPGTQIVVVSSLGGSATQALDIQQ